jgi:hypothetical protein
MITDTVFLVGAAVRAADGPVGELARLVVDPGAGRLTHLAVERSRHTLPDRLVPLGMVASCLVDIVLSCTTTEFSELPQAEDTRPGPTEHAFLRLPRPPVLAAARTMGLGLAAAGDDDALQTRDTVPLGEDELRAGQGVEAADGRGGHFRGLTVGVAGRITGLVMDRDRSLVRRRVVVPVDAVVSLGRVIRIELTRAQLKALAEAGWMPDHS